MYRMSERGFYWLTRGYKVSLGWVLRHQPLILVIAIVMLVVNVYLYIIVPKGFFPQQDTGRLAGMVMGEQDVSFDAMKTKTDATDRHRQQGSGGGERSGVCRRQWSAESGPHVRRAEAAERAQGERRRGDRALASQAIACPGRDIVFCSPSQDLQIGGRMSNAQYQYTLSGEDLDELYEWAPSCWRKLRKIPAAERC